MGLYIGQRSQAVHELSDQKIRWWCYLHCRSGSLRARNAFNWLILSIGPIGDGAMALYIYAVGAPFEAILNNYMITSQAIHPPAVSPGLNGNLTGPATNGSLELVWALQDT